MASTRRSTKLSKGTRGHIRDIEKALASARGRTDVRARLEALLGGTKKNPGIARRKGSTRKPISRRPVRSNPRAKAASTLITITGAARHLFKVDGPTGNSSIEDSFRAAEVEAFRAAWHASQMGMKNIKIFIDAPGYNRGTIPVTKAQLTRLMARAKKDGNRALHQWTERAADRPRRNPATKRRARKNPSRKAASHLKDIQRRLSTVKDRAAARARLEKLFGGVKKNPGLKSGIPSLSLWNKAAKVNHNTGLDLSSYYMNVTRNGRLASFVISSVLITPSQRKPLYELSVLVSDKDKSSGRLVASSVRSGNIMSDGSLASPDQGYRFSSPERAITAARKAWNNWLSRDMDDDKKSNPRRRGKRNPSKVTLSAAARRHLTEMSRRLAGTKNKSAAKAKLEKLFGSSRSNPRRSRRVVRRSW